VDRPWRRGGAARRLASRDARPDLRSINAAYSDSMLEIYRDGELSLAAKKSLISRNMRQVAAALAAWHRESLDIVTVGSKLRSSLADQHAELQRTLANFGGRWIDP
jgi:hypothetical protein